LIRRTERFYLWHLGEDGLREVALLDIPDSKVSEDEPPARLRVGFRFFRGVVGLAADNLIDLPNTILSPCSPLRTDPPSSLACLKVSQKGETYLVADNRKRFIPQYVFLLMRLRGNLAAVHGRRHGITPCSSTLMIFPVTIS
jgi:hypothetical protein